MSDTKDIPGLTPEQQEILHNFDLPSYKTQDFVYGFDEARNNLRVVYLDALQNATHAVIMPTELALNLARHILRTVAQPQQPK